MHVIQARNVHQALPLGMRYLQECGIPMPSRAGDVIVAPGPVTTVYERPCERVLFWPERDVNPWLHLLDGLWVLAGRNDVALLARFAKRMMDYSDDGVTLHGAYGYRLRKHFSVSEHYTGDQLEAAVEELRADPLSRRVVLTMWDAEEDLGRRGRDLPCNVCIFVGISYGKRDEPNRLNITVCCRSNDAIWGCLAGDTMIKSPEGDLPLKSLATRFDLGLKRFPVYAVDPNTGDMALKWCTKAWKTGIKPIRELIFDDGSVLRLTKDHVLYNKQTKRGQKNSIRCIVPIEAGELKVGDRIWAPWYSKEGKRVKFKKNILGNTEFSNMQLTSVAYDELLHGPNCFNLDIHHKDDDFTNDRATNLERLTVSEHRSHHMTERMLALSPEERFTWAKRGSDAAAVAIADMSEEEREDLYNRRSEHSSETMRKYFASLSPEERKEHTKRALDAAALVNTFEDYQERGRRGSASRWADPEQRKRQSELMKRLNEERRLRSNHKIVAINELSPEEVFDFTVEDYHTALVGNGVLAHNCYGANAVQFSMIQEYLAARLGLAVGTYHQMSNNYHAYTDIFEKTRVGNLRLWNPTWNTSPYDEGSVSPQPLVTHPESWDEECQRFLEDPERDAIYRNDIFGGTARQLWATHAAYVEKDYEEAMALAETVEAQDWRRAAVEWLERRAVARSKK